MTLYVKDNDILKPVSNENTPTTTDHSKLLNLDYESSGHIGFASEKGLNDEIQRATTAEQVVTDSIPTSIQTHNESLIAHPDLRSIIENINTNIIPDISVRLSARENIAGYVKSNNFGVAEPLQSDLTFYVKGRLWPNDSPLSHPDTDIFNGTRVVNEFDGNTWVLANSPDSDPPVFIWENAGKIGASIASDSAVGVVRSSEAKYMVNIDPVTGVMTINGLEDDLNYLNTEIDKLM